MSWTTAMDALRVNAMSEATMTKRAVWALCLVMAAAWAAPASAQTCSDGSDGSRVVPAGSAVVVNGYYPSPNATTSVAAGATTIPVIVGAAVGDPTPISAGDLLMVIQLQGAQIDGGSQATVGAPYGDGPGGADRQGLIARGFVAGRYELARAAGAPMGGVVPLQHPLRNAYESGQNVVSNGDGTGGGPRRYQVVRIPQYVNLTINGTVTGVPWNGRAGGVVALDVLGALVINDDGNPATDTIDASGLGFRGGSPVIPTSNDNVQDGIRGEGVAGTPARAYSERRFPPIDILASSRYFAGDSERGGPGNAGGVGLILDSGGGGGAGFGDGGEGRVGQATGSGLLAPNRARGGRGIDDLQRLFMGGGGGSGTLDDPTPVAPVSGQAGGGVVLVRARSIAGNGTIGADGDGAASQAQEGSGGGGGGGNVLVVTASASLGSVALHADGGDGTTTMLSNDAGGGGGGGGRVMVGHPLGDSVTFSATVFGGNGGGATATIREGEDGQPGLSELLSALPASSACADPDTDGDGVPDFRDEDDDNDGILDANETAGLFTGDPSGDADADGVPNYQDRDYYVTVLAMPGLCPDAGGDGVCDSLDGGLVDADGDGVPNHLDRDADQDGITDVFETRGLDADGDGVPDNCASINAVGICLDTGGAPITVTVFTNTDGGRPGGDAIPDYLDPDSDADGLSDAIEAHDSSGNGALGGGETTPSGNDHDGDGIDDAYDPDCTAVGTPVGCAAAGDPVTTPLAGYRDQDGDGTPDWRETCGDAYVRGTEACDTGGASATCTAACLLTNGQPCAISGECASMVCNATTMTCTTCDDTSTGGVDQGCTAGAPACVTSGGTATCRACEDDQTGTGIDDGCGGATPLCDPAANVCRACLDLGVGVTDLGCGGATPVCGGTGAGACQACENNDPGTSNASVDFGCGGATPFCSTSGGAPVCIACLGAANCSDGNDCTTDVCTAGACTNPNAALGATCGAGDACDGAGTCVDCVNDRASGTDSGCAAGSPFCDATMGTAGMCVQCLATSDCPSGQFCNPSGMCTPGCSTDADCAGGLVCDTGSMVCVTCLDSMSGGGVDRGCAAAAPICAGASGMGTAGTACVECTESAHCAMGVCDVARSTCDVCVDDATGAGTDSGCMAPTPICDVTGAGAACVECATDAHCPGSQVCSPAQTCEFGDSDGDGLPDDIDIDDDNDGIPDVVEGGGTDYSVDSDSDGIPDYVDPDAVTCMDLDANGSCDELPVGVDLDQDGVPNHLDLDADGDGIADTTEGHDANRDGVPDTAVPMAFVDTDMDGLADAYDPDNGGRAAAAQDSDGDSRPDFLDTDSDGDGLLDRVEATDANGDGAPDILPRGVDFDGDGIDDAFDVDQGGRAPAGPDADADGHPDYLDADSDGDGIRDLVECADPTACPDTDLDGVPDHLDLDADGDGIPDATEGHDADMNGVPDVTPAGADADMDGIDDAFDPDAGGVVAPLPDTDMDGTQDWRDPDDDGDGVGTTSECADPTMTCPDMDMDGTPDYLDPDGGPSDMDMDGLSDDVECAGDIAMCPDTDGDGMPDHQDPDDDGDGVPTRVECVGGPAVCDRDGDGRPNHLDIDSDDDGILDRLECTVAECEDTDGDGVPDLWDLDTDGDGILDSIEGHDANMDGAPDRIALGMDADGDGLDDAYDPDNGGTDAPLQDTDADGTPDWRDVDDDMDGIVTSLECVDPMSCPDTDMDGTPDYLDADSIPTDTDMDGIPDVVECPPPGDPVGNPTGCPDTDGDGRPNFDDPDDDNDGIPTRQEVYDGDGDPTDDDTDRDGVPDYLDPDDDNDGIPTATECPNVMAGCPDTDGDGFPDYRDVCGDGQVSALEGADWEQCDDGNQVDGDGCDMTCRLEGSPGERDTDMDGLFDSVECPPPGDPIGDPAGCPDTDGDGRPDFDDPDDDGDGVPTRTELGTGGPSSPRDTDGDGTLDYLDPDDDNDTLPTADELGEGGAGSPRDFDGDGIPDFLDPDDDNDTIPTATEVTDGRALPTPSDDVDGDGAPNWLDVDADGDGVPDMDEPDDAGGNGIPDYLEPGSGPTVGGVSGGALCAVEPGSGGAPLGLALLAVAVGAFGFRRRRRR